MEKNRFDFFRKYEKIIFSTVIFLIGMLIVFINTLEISDELWLFHHTYKMTIGFSIYNDINVIITPLFFYLGKLLLMLFGKNFIIFRLYDLLIFVILYFISYKIMKTLGFSTHIAFLSTIMLFLLTMSIVTAGANYNTLVMVFVLLGILMYLKKNNNFLLHGLVIFLVFFTKQNVGVYYLISVVICDLYLYKFSLKFLVTITKKLLVFVILSALIFLQMFLSGNFFSFINFTFGGLLEFRENNICFTASPYYLIIYLFSFILYFFICIKRKTLLAEVINEDNFKNFSILIIFTTFISFITYPIFNSAHFLFAIPLHFIIIVYFFNILIFDDLYGSKEYVGPCNFITFIILVLILLRIGSYYIEQYSKTTYVDDKNSPFYAIPVYTEHLEKSKKIKNYILEQNEKGIDVIIISDDAPFFLVELNQNHLMYDLLFVGNMGYDGENKIKSDIVSRENTQFLIVTKDEDVFEQQSPEIREFIKENLTCKGTICNYSIYEK